MSPESRYRSGMTSLDEFRASVSADAPPADTGPALQALWWVAKGDWERAHKAVQGHDGQPQCAWVHAHLHRVEGDLSNAGYWYRRAERPAATVPLDVEWDQLAQALLA